MVTQAVVQARIAPIYEQADESSALADEALHGMTVDIMEERPGALCRVRTHYGYEGFMRTADLCRDAANHAAWQTAVRCVIDSFAVDVLDAPRVQALRTHRLTKGCQIVRLDNAGDDWARVRLADGCEGFVRDKLAGAPIPTFAEEGAFRRAVVATALSYRGVQYRWGGKTPEGIDCSGLCSMAYMLNGILICRDARPDDAFPVRAIEQGCMKPGDLLYFPGHMAMVIGGNRFVHATAVGDGVCVNSMDKTDEDYRADLAESLLSVGSVF